MLLIKKEPRPKAVEKRGPIILHPAKLYFKRSGGQGQDGGVRRCGVHVSPQLGHMLDTGGGPQCPRK